MSRLAVAELDAAAYFQIPDVFEILYKIMAKFPIRRDLHLPRIDDRNARKKAKKQEVHQENPHRTYYFSFLLNDAERIELLKGDDT